MAKFRIEHDRPNCIGCAACVTLAPHFWEMNPDDGKSDIKNSKKDERDWEILDIEKEDFESNKDAADACPVNVIHIVDKKDNKRII